MEIVTLNIERRVLNSMSHFKRWTPLTEIARGLGMTNSTAERICWRLVVGGLMIWRPGKKREQLFKYAPMYYEKEKADLLALIGETLEVDYYITGESGMFYLGLTAHGMFQHTINVAISSSRYKEYVRRLVGNISRYATVLPRNLPKHCMIEESYTECKRRGPVVIVEKAKHNPRKLKFWGPGRIPQPEILLDEIETDERTLLEYGVKSVGWGMRLEDLKGIGTKKPILLYLYYYYADKKKEIPKEILNQIKEVVHHVEGY